VEASELSVEAFEAQYLRGGGGRPVPVVLRNALSAWPALVKWGDMEYIKGAAAGRLVPVETFAEADAAQTYLSDSWVQRVMPLRDYIERYVEGAPAGGAVAGGAAAAAEDDDDDDDVWEDEALRGYLAQHPLFDQIPALRRDIAIPPHCRAVGPEDGLAPAECEVRGEPIVSAWFGPGGTVSPLHNDPYHNLLGQVVGAKYVRLYDASDSDLLYPRSGPLCNNSLVNLDALDHSAFPRFGAAPCWQTVLGPGDLLFIPRHYWHYVRSLSLSFSVSFWWGAKMGLRRTAAGVYEAVY